MNTKITGILAGCMLATLAIVPIGFAHNAPTGETEPSGNYVGPAGPWVQIDGVDIFAGNALCDAEVASDGNDATTDDNDLDETIVDSVNPTLGTLADGTFDDGGQGAVCHTPNSHYVNANYNTQTCDYVDSGLEATSSENAWLSTSCDYQTVIAGPDGPTIDILLLNAVGCTINNVLTGVATLPNIVTDCIDTLLDCLLGVSLDADSCPVNPGDDVACGEDGTIDDTEQGPGLAGVPYAEYGDCAATDGVAATFVWDAVIIDSTLLPDASAVTVYPATTGHVG